VKKLIKWRVSERPTGEYASFQYRAWPMAYVGDEAVVQLVSTGGAGRGNTNGYSAYAARTGNHEPLRVMIRWPEDASNPNDTWGWRYLKGGFDTLPEAKAAAERFWEKHPAQLPTVGA
jgi:hypothetical protein